MALVLAREVGEAGMDDSALRAALAEAFQALGPRRWVLAVPPDLTRHHSRAGRITELAWEHYGDALTDVLPALGTHAPMTEEELGHMFGRVPGSLFRVHRFREDVETLGRIPADELRALIAAIRDGSGIIERPMQRDEAVHWMAYQSRPGQYDAISPACLRLERHYEAFEITVEVPGPEPVAQAPTCVVTATRNCEAENATFTVDLRGSSPGAQVTLATGGQPAVAIGGPGESWSVPDPGPFALDAVFTVRAQGAPAAARTARVFRFVMPKICGNVAYLGEAPSRTIAPAAAATATRPCSRACATSTQPLRHRTPRP